MMFLYMAKLANNRGTPMIITLNGQVYVKVRPSAARRLYNKFVIWLYSLRSIL